MTGEGHEIEGGAVSRTAPPSLPSADYGVRFERTMTMGTEDRREAVYRDGIYIGDVVYVRRRRKALAGSSSATGFVSDYGWRPDGWRYAKNAKLTDRSGAVERLRSVV